MEKVTKHKILGTRLAVSYVDRNGAYLIPIRDGKIGVVETTKVFFSAVGSRRAKRTRNVLCGSAWRKSVARRW